ncbi:MAG: signal peptide peptidase SppA [Acidobacteria bacterium]|nr:signal peptide peptidase SppA [Acidobacteriota bacterium]
MTIGSVALAYWSRGTTPNWRLHDSIGVVAIEGEIWESRSVVEQLEEYRDDSRVHAIIVRIDSPGGAIVPSQEIYSAILDLREESDKPILASMAGLAASGGYYIASACDRIVANRGTITGSIGVIAQWLNFEGTLEWARITPVTVTSGSMKDVGNPFREMSPEELEYFQALLGQMHDQFIDAVLEARQGKLTREQLVEIADGRVYTGEQAVEIGLVDDLGTMWDAVDMASDMADLDEPSLIWARPYRPTLFDLFFGTEKTETVVSRLLTPNSRRPLLLYRWY